MAIELAEDGIRIDGRSWRAEEILGFHERYDAWRGRVWLHVAGPDVSVRVGEGYGALRAALRARHPRLPFTSDWGATGRFQGLVLGAPGAPLTVGLTGVALAACAVAGAVLGTWAGALVGLGLVWPLGRLRTAVLVRREGIAAGPAWAPWIGWHEVSEVRVSPRGRRVRVWVAHQGGVSTVDLPAAVVPALRARLRRLGALPLVEGSFHLDLRYLSWRPLAAGAPWGVLLAVCLLAPLAADPWLALSRGLLVAAAVGMVGAAVEARLAGWRTGGVFWMTAAWAAALVAMALGLL